MTPTSWCNPGRAPKPAMAVAMETATAMQRRHPNAGSAVRTVDA